MNSDNSDSDCQIEESDDEQPPNKRIKLSTTFTNYFYKSLFCDHQDSDISIVAREKTWKLHKIILKQSPYFAGMFSGAWKEATEQVVTITIDDENITQDSLNLIFGGLYHSDIILDSENVVSVLATANLFQIQEVINECNKFMKEMVHDETVMPYYNAAILYELEDLETLTKQWLLVNLVDYGCFTCPLLREITPEMMAGEILSSPNLIVRSAEFNVYLMLRKWLFAHLASNMERSSIVRREVDEFYKTNSWVLPFITTKEGEQYKSSFESLRLKYMLFDSTGIKTVKEDNIIPHTLIDSAVCSIWQSISRINVMDDYGLLTEVSEDMFEKECSRYGFYICSRDEFEEDLDFLFGLMNVNFSTTEDGTSLTLEWTKGTNRLGLLEDYRLHNIMIKISAMSLNDALQVTHEQKTELRTIELIPGCKISLLDFDEDLIFPTQISVKVLDVSPNAIILNNPQDNMPVT